jgi:hypothetical protein
MRHTYLKALFGLYAFVLLSSILQSCCKEEERYTGAGHLSAYQGEEYNQDLDTVIGSFFLRVQFEFIIEQVSVNDISFMNSAYATSCANEQTNSLDEETFTLTVDKSFEYNGDQVESGTNLLELNTVDADLKFNGYNLDIHFTQEFINKSSLGDSSYNFVFTGKTSDNLTMEFEKNLWIKK